MCVVGFPSNSLTNIIMTCDGHANIVRVDFMLGLKNIINGVIQAVFSPISALEFYNKITIAVVKYTVEFLNEALYPTR